MAQTYSTELSRLLRGIAVVPAALDTRIHGIQLDSRMVRRGDLFVALAGVTAAGAHVEEAIKNGANAVVIEGALEQGRIHESGDAVELYLPDIRSKLSDIANNFFRNPSRDLKVVGVTGTNGKTSVSNFIAQLLSLDGMESAVIGTLGYGFPLSAEGLTEIDRTTPNVFDVHRYLAKLRDQGAACVVMEVSSHGLQQGRVDGVHFEGAVLTNLSRDHLDYHLTMDAYADAKRQLFRTDGLGFAVLNVGQAFSASILEILAPSVQVIQYGLDSKADIRAESLVYGVAGVQANLVTPLASMPLSSNLMGRFNVENLLAASAVCVALGRTVDCLKRINRVHSVLGRMSVLQADNRPAIVVDYAHTPDALLNILTALRPHCKGQLSLVFGCGGDRDVGKRPLMAEVAEKLADRLVITDDNPRTEDPEAIVDDILKGLATPSVAKVIHDRKAAITHAVEQAQNADVIVVAGKGHEQYQEIAGRRHVFSDIEVSKALLGLGLVDADSLERGVAHD